MTDHVVRIEPPREGEQVKITRSSNGGIVVERTPRPTMGKIWDEAHQLQIGKRRYV